MVCLYWTKLKRIFFFLSLFPLSLWHRAFYNHDRYLRRSLRLMRNVGIPFIVFLSANKISTHVQPKKPRNWRYSYENESHRSAALVSAKFTTVAAAFASIDPPSLGSRWSTSQLRKLPFPQSPQIFIALEPTN